MRWKSDPSRPIGSDGVTRGWSTAWPSTTRPLPRIEAGTVQRVRHLPDQPLHDVARQPRVGVERDHVANAGGNQRGGIAVGDEARVGGAAQQAVQLVQLAALALPADPLAFALVPEPAPVQQQEAIAVGGRRVPLIQPRDSSARGREQRVVAGLALGGGVRPVREQREADVAVRSRQVMHFESLDLLLDLRTRGQQRGHHDERAQPRPARRRAARDPAAPSARTDR